MTTIWQENEISVGACKAEPMGLLFKISDGVHSYETSQVPKFEYDFLNESLTHYKETFKETSDD